MEDAPEYDVGGGAIHLKSGAEDGSSTMNTEEAATDLEAVSIGVQGLVCLKVTAIGGDMIRGARVIDEVCNTGGQQRC